MNLNAQTPPNKKQILCDIPGKKCFPLEMNSVPIQPVDRVKTTTIDGFQVRVLGVELFKSVMVSVMLMSSGNIVDTQIVTLSGDEYSQWTNDDQTLMNIVAEKLGFTLA